MSPINTLTRPEDGFDRAMAAVLAALYEGDDGLGLDMSRRVSVEPETDEDLQSWDVLHQALGLIYGGLPRGVEVVMRAFSHLLWCKTCDRLGYAPRFADYHKILGDVAVALASEYGPDAIDEEDVTKRKKGEPKEPERPVRSRWKPDDARIDYVDDQDEIHMKDRPLFRVGGYEFEQLQLDLTRYVDTAVKRVKRRWTSDRQEAVRRQPLRKAHLADESEAPPGAVSEEQALKTLEERVAELEELDRQLFQMKLDGKSQKEIAASIGRSESMVSKRLKSIRKKIA